MLDTTLPVIDKIGNLVNEIENNIKVINQKSNELAELKIRETMQAINIARRHLTFSEIENIIAFNTAVNGSGINSFYTLCKHAIKVGEYKSGARKFNNYMNEKSGVYELWLLWNNEFCVTRAYYEKSSENDEEALVREVTEYGPCAFNMCNNEFIWNVDGIIATIMANLESNLKEKQDIRVCLESQLT